MPITRTAMIDDDGSGLTGTIINNAWKQELYNQIDAVAGHGYTLSVTDPSVIYLPPDYASYLVLVTSSVPALSHGCLMTTGAFRPGARLTIINSGAGYLTLRNLSSSVAYAQYINFASAQDATRLAPASGTYVGGAASYVWNAPNSHWLLSSHDQGGPIPLSLAVAGCTTPGALYGRYVLAGRDAHVRIQIENFGIPAPSTANVTVSGFPWNWDKVGTVHMTAFTNYDPNHQTWGILPVFPGTNTLDVSYPGFWPVLPGNLYVALDFTFPIS